MGLILRIKSKDGQTVEVPLEAGMIIGRSPAASLKFEDPKLSGQHAQIELNAAGQFIIRDLGSTNGIRHEEKKVTELLLEPGVEFKMGNGIFAVKSSSTEIEAPPKPPKKLRKEPPSSEAPAPPPAPVRPPERWPDYFVKFIRASLKKITDKPRELSPFSRIVKLSFIRGLQSETVWTLGYGPRDVGPSSVDLVIEELSAPPICFTLEPDGRDVLFKTEHPMQVKLNDRSIKSDTLKSGDVISIADTRITVGFAE